VDLLHNIGDETFAYEIKSGATFNKNYSKGLNYWSKLSAADSEHKSVIYGGNASLNTTDGNALSWNEI
jgi:hypothetical protein